MKSMIEPLTTINMILRILNICFILIVIISGLTMALTGDGIYKGIQTSGVSMRILGAGFAILGLYYLIVGMVTKRKDSSRKDSEDKD
jgi:hypothetical protein